LGKNLKCDTFSKLNHLIDHLLKFNMENLSETDYLYEFNNAFESLVEYELKLKKDNETESDKNENNFISKQIYFLKEQVNLIYSSRNRYSTDTLVLCFAFFNNFPKFHVSLGIMNSF
jgi:hypothetical protein